MICRTSLKNMVFAMNCFQQQSYCCQRFCEILFLSCFKNSVKTSLHNVSRYETLILSMMNLAVHQLFVSLKVAKKIQYFLWFLRSNFLAFRRFLNPQLIQQQPPVSIDEVSYIKFHEHGHNFFFCFEVLL